MRALWFGVGELTNVTVAVARMAAVAVAVRAEVSVRAVIHCEDSECEGAESFSLITSLKVWLFCLGAVSLITSYSKVSQKDQ